MNDELLYFTPKMKHNITKKQNKTKVTVSEKE